jgi:hypothetical protein
VSSHFNGLEPWLVPYAGWLLYYGHQADPSIKVTSVRRSYAEQSRLYRRFQMGLSAFPVARPGTSWHEYGRAFDMVARPEVLSQLGATWKSWGGSWWPSDPIHFQA